MKLVATTILFFFFSLSGNALFAQNVNFIDAKEMPVGRSAHGTATNGKSIFVCNGFTTQSSYSSEVYEYNLIDDEWSLLTDSTIEKRFSAAEIISEKLYLLNGVDSNNEVVWNLEIVDITTGEIRQGAATLWPAKSVGTAVWQGKLYAFGGSYSDMDFSNKFAVYFPFTDQWTDLPELPVGIETRGEFVDGKLYVFGGWNGGVSNRIDMFNLQTNRWTQIGTMPKGISAHATAVDGTKIWLVGDYSDLESLAYFDTKDNSFHEVQSNMMGRRHAGAVTIDEKLYVVGGNQTSSISSSLPSVQVSEIVSSTLENEDSKSILAFPNPVTDNLNLQQRLKSATIYNVDGKVVKRLFEVVPFQNIDVSDLKSGNYVLIGSSDYQNYKVKFVKQ